MEARRPESARRRNHFGIFMELEARGACGLDELLDGCDNSSGWSNWIQCALAVATIWRPATEPSARPRCAARCSVG